MKVILQQNVPKVGKKYEVVDVAQGYAEHALFPKKLAIQATPQALEKLARTKQSAQNERALKHKLLDEAISSVRDQVLVISAKTNEQGSLFSKIDEREISKALMNTHRISIDTAHMSIQGGPIKKAGTYLVDVTDEGYHATFSIEVR